MGNSLLNPFGIYLAPTSISGLRKSSGSSLDAIVLELSRFEGDSVLATVSLNVGRGLPQFSWGKKGTHPFVKAAKAGLECDSFEDARVAVTKSLEDFYASYQPRTIHEMFWDVAEAPGKLAEYPAWAVMMPWQGGDDIDSWMQEISRTVRKEGRRGKRWLTIKDGWSWSGPVSPEKLKLEATRLTKTLQAIKKRGYRRHDGYDGDIRAVVLANSDGEWVWQSYAGQHRAAVLSALEEDQIPVRLSGLVRVHDAPTWPQVAKGLYNVHQAVHVFNSVFASNKNK